MQLFRNQELKGNPNQVSQTQGFAKPRPATVINELKPTPIPLISRPSAATIDNVSVLGWMEEYYLDYSRSQSHALLDSIFNGDNCSLSSSCRESLLRISEHICNDCTKDHLEDHTCKKTICKKDHLEDHKCPTVTCSHNHDSFANTEFCKKSCNHSLQSFVDLPKTQAWEVNGQYVCLMYVNELYRLHKWQNDSWIIV